MASFLCDIVTTTDKRQRQIESRRTLTTVHGSFFINRKLREIECHLCFWFSKGTLLACQQVKHCAKYFWNQLFLIFSLKNYMRNVLILCVIWTVNYVGLMQLVDFSCLKKSESFFLFDFAFLNFLASLARLLGMSMDHNDQRTNEFNSFIWTLGTRLPTGHTKLHVYLEKGIFEFSVLRKSARQKIPCKRHFFFDNSTCSWSIERQMFDRCREPESRSMAMRWGRKRYYQFFGIWNRFDIFGEKYK